MQQRVADNPAFIVQLWRGASRLQYSSQPSVALPLMARQGFSTVSSGGMQWRVFSLTAGERTVQAAQSVDDRRDTAAEMVMRMLVPFLILVCSLVWLAWLAVGKGLAPLNRVAADIGRRDSLSMQPLDEMNVPAEIRPLVVALNDLLRRLESALNTQRQFVADAAHELRTPLTALSLQAQLVQQSTGEDDRNEAVRDLRRGIVRATHLVNQLLDLARQEPDTRRSLAGLDLARLVREKAGELAPLAAEKEIDLVVEADIPQWIDGDAASLGLLVGNLVDNAIRYTPAGGRVIVALGANNGSVVLSVSDNGCGIPEEERDRVFERFYRPAGQRSPGSGLGLAIVSQVAKLHHADIRLMQPDAGPGTVFHVNFHPAGTHP